MPKLEATAWPSSLAVGDQCACPAPGRQMPLHTRGKKMVAFWSRQGKVPVIDDKQIPCNNWRRKGIILPVTGPAR